MLQFDTFHERKAEIAAKLERVRRMLDENDLQGVLLTNHYNFSWITAGAKNFVANCFDKGDTAVLVTRNDCFALCSIIEAPRICQEEKLEELGFSVRVFGWELDETAQIVSALVDPSKVITDRPVGSFSCRPELISPLRWEMTPSERDRYCWFGRTMSQALEAYLLTVRPGMTEYEIAGGISQALWTQGIEQVMHLVTVDDRGYYYRHGLPSQKQLKKSLIVSVNGRYHGLITTTSRMLCVGNVPQQLVEKYQACLEIETAAMGQTLVGTPEKDIYHCLKDTYAHHGWEDMFRRHGQGGCQGYLPREYMITANVSGAVTKNRAYCYNPVIDGAKSEDAFLVEENGIRMITQPMLFDAVPVSVNGQQVLRPAIAVVG